MSSAVALRALDQHQKHGLPLPVIGADTLERHLVWEAVAIRADIRELESRQEEARQAPLEDAKRQAAERLAAGKPGAG